jgi:hypothetical protein
MKNELFHYVVSIDFEAFMKSFNQFNVEDKREYLARVHYSYTERRVYLEETHNQLVYNGLSIEQEFKSYEYRYRLQFQTEICLQTSAGYLYLNMIKLEEYYYKKILED